MITVIQARNRGPHKAGKSLGELAEGIAIHSHPRQRRRFRPGVFSRSSSRAALATRHHPGAESGGIVVSNESSWVPRQSLGST